VFSLYWESFRQDARERLKNINDLASVKSQKNFDKAIEDLSRAAFPPDPDSDGDFGKDDIKMLKKALGSMEEVNA
jgi:hypothetical protein